ncbi:MAG: DUF1844 domain-containing protein [Planctomycetota bacterium]
MSESEEKKIIIDEDWKSQVEREKEELKQKEEGQPAGSPADEPATDAPMGSLPPASLMFLITTIATQCMAAMGQLVDPATGQPTEVHLELAQHHIDTLQVLQEKTQGNLDAEEAGMLEESLHQLRMMFVSASSSA